MPERTALASIEWAGTRAVVRDVVCPAGDKVILDFDGQAGKTGIDCPLGWQTPLLISSPPIARGMSHFPDGLGTGWRRPLTMRRTNVFVQEKLHLMPLSVLADRIAHGTLRCAVLLAKLDALGRRSFAPPAN